VLTLKDFFSDMVFHITLGAVTALNADYWTNPQANPAEGRELLAYVTKVGEAICTRVRFDVNGNPLDEYDEEVLNFHDKFFITPNKRVGWDRSVGQEVPWMGIGDVNRDPVSGNHGRGAGVREQLSFLNGPQTPKPTQPALDLWIPLIFWFNY
jgi:hypothetical protein